MKALAAIESRTTGRHRLLARCTAVVLGSVLAVSVLAYDAPGMRDAMSQVFASMRVLLELSTDQRNLKDPANADTILTATTELADMAGLISAHAPRDEMSYLAASLERFASWIRRSYEWGHFGEMQGQIHDAVELCVACHTRLPSPGDSPLAQGFLRGHDLDALSGLARARLEMATRRFDDARSTLEQSLGEPVAEDDFLETLTAYLVVTLRVKGDPARARTTLDTLASSQGTTPRRRAILTELVAALRRLESHPPAPGDLGAARVLVRDAEAGGDAKRAAGLVNYVEASRLLYQFLETGRGSADEGAEAYYLLGLSRSRMEPDTWLSQAELYLEKAIRTAPGSEHSRRALDLLESHLTRRLGKGGQDLPEDIRKYLDMLREMHGA